jgi:hypothetical protein
MRPLSPMRPLYTARIEDLSAGDFVKLDCTACDHTALLSLESLLRSDVQPRDRVLDLKDRVRCRGWCAGSGRRLDHVGQAGCMIVAPDPPQCPLSRSVCRPALNSGLRKADRETFWSQNWSHDAVDRTGYEPQETWTFGRNRANPSPGTKFVRAPVLSTKARVGFEVLRHNMDYRVTRALSDGLRAEDEISAVNAGIIGTIFKRLIYHGHHRRPQIPIPSDRPLAASRPAT